MAATSPDVGGEETTTLQLKHAQLTLGKDSLKIDDRSPSKPNRTCGIFGSPPSSTTTSIPYYNILWIELSPDEKTVTLSYAKPISATRLQAQKLSWIVLPSGPSEAMSNPDIHRFTARVLDNAYGPEVTRCKRAWVVVNPNAGPGGATKIWEKHVKPIFEAAKMPLTVVQTKAAREGIDLAKNLNIDDFDIAVPCSGDGGPHEIFNGFGKRSDARRALSKIAVCHIPCGSGNAMSCNIYGSHYPTLAALAIVKGVPTPLDLMSVTQGDTRILSFLSQAYGVMADIDIKTEHLRWMGETRFTVGFLQLVLKKKTYPCDIAFKVEIDGKENIRAHYRNHIEGGSQPKPDGNGAADGLSDATADSSEDQGLPPLKYGTTEDKLPEGWELLPYENLGYFFCGNMGYVAPKQNFFPAALHNDGLMDLITMPGDHPPLKMISLQTKVPNNTFFDSDLVTYRKVSAFRLSPRTHDEDGVISIDGEPIPYRPFQAEVHPGLGLTLTRTGKFEAPGPQGWETAPRG